MPRCVIPDGHPILPRAAYIPEVMPPRDSPRAKVHQNGRSSSRIVVQLACKISRRLYRRREIRNRTYKMTNKHTVNYTVSQKNVPPIQLAIIFTYTVRLRQFLAQMLPRK